MQFRNYQNIYEILKETAEAFPEYRAYRWITSPGESESVNWHEFNSEVRAASKSLIKLGLEKADKICILSYSCYRWVATDLGNVSIGGVTVGIYQSNLPEDCHYIIDHSEAKFVFVENLQQLNKILEIRDRLPRVEKVIMFNDSYKGDDWILAFEDFLTLGRDVPDSVVEKMISSVSSDDLATIVYTSGTTGVPRGAMLTHENVTFTVQSAEMSASIEPHSETFCFLPYAHIFARLLMYVTMKINASTTYTRSMDTIIDDIQVSKPDWFISVPRIFEKVYSRVLSGAEAKGGAALKIFRWAIKIGGKVSDYKLQKKNIPSMTKIKYSIATKLVFSKLQAVLGGNLKWCISGAAPLNPTIAKFFHAAGILILEGIGMTENMSFTNVNRYDNYRFGWVGQPGPGIEQKIADDGEILFRGKNVMKGYYKMPEETAETIDSDGWLHTGDLGEIDSEGFLRVTGRKKDLIITAGGKNIAPSSIETLIATSKYIAQACVIGDKRKFLTALVTLDAENITDYAEQNGIEYSSFEDLMGNEKIEELITGDVETKNSELASFETIKKIKIVEEFTIENELLTPTMKPKRKKIMDHHASLIDSMYLEN